MQKELEASRTALMLGTVLSALVDDPERIAVVMSDPGDCVLLSVSVQPKEYGKVIGKRGHMARSLRTILNAVSVRTGVKFELNIVLVDSGELTQ